MSFLGGFAPAPVYGGFPVYAGPSNGHIHGRRSRRHHHHHHHGHHHHYPRGAPFGFPGFGGPRVVYAAPVAAAKPAEEDEEEQNETVDESNAEDSPVKAAPATPSRLVHPAGPFGYGYPAPFAPASPFGFPVYGGRSRSGRSRSRGGFRGFTGAHTATGPINFAGPHRTFSRSASAAYAAPISVGRPAGRPVSSGIARTSSVPYSAAFPGSRIVSSPAHGHGRVFGGTLSATGPVVYGGPRYAAAPVVQEPADEVQEVASSDGGDN